MKKSGKGIFIFGLAFFSVTQHTVSHIQYTFSCTYTNAIALRTGDCVCVSVCVCVCVVCMCA